MEELVLGISCNIETQGLAWVHFTKTDALPEIWKGVTV